MREIQNIEQTIGFMNETNAIEVTLQANQYRLDKLTQYQHFLAPGIRMLSGEITEATEEKLVIRYKKESATLPLEQVVKKEELFQRLLLAQKIHFLTDFLHRPAQPFLHPANLFVRGEELVIGHRGFMETIVPYINEEDDFIKQYRALVLYILHPRLNYELLIEGSGTLKDAFTKKINEADTIEIIDQLLATEILKQKQKRAKETQVVSKRNHQIFKWSSLVLGVSTIGFAVATGIYALDKLPAQERISSAETQYIANDYAGVLNTLKEDEPEKLPTGAKYVAAVSAVQLDNLSNEQKAAILNNLSLKSSDNTLLYWIYAGKGNFDKALDVAKNLGDNQYILHAYTKLYDATKTNNKMKGEKKQELLTKYEEEINKYMKLLGGEDGNEAN